MLLRRVKVLELEKVVEVEEVEMSTSRPGKC